LLRIIFLFFLYIALCTFNYASVNRVKIEQVQTQYLNPISPEGGAHCAPHIAEGVLLDNLFSDLNLTQLISEPTHFFRDDCKPSCIDLIVTDQPNIFLNSGVSPSLDPTVKHQITFCKINFKILRYQNMLEKSGTLTEQG
jgi:hypothetical protein